MDVIDMRIYEGYGELGKRKERRMETYKYEDIWRVNDKQKMRKPYITNTSTIHFRLSLN